MKLCRFHTQFGSMDRPQGTITFDLTLATLIMLMMAQIAENILRWYAHLLDNQNDLSEQSIDYLSDYLVYQLTYFSVLWGLLQFTVTITLFSEGNETTSGYLSTRRSQFNLSFRAVKLETIPSPPA